MTIDPRPEPSTAHHRLVECADCASTVHTVMRPGAVMSVEVEHCDSCPSWREREREVALVVHPRDRPEGAA